jgi:ATP-dependent helicase HrpB
MRPFPTPLPIDAVLDRLMTSLRAQPRAVLVAPPGAGKTTRVPLAMLEAGFADKGKILVLEPRRLAARGAAARMAQSLGEEVGETVGLRARLGSRIGPRTRIEVITEGIFTRMVLDDPGLEGIAAVLFDEFHERSLDADFGLALALDVQTGLRDNLRLLVMSATLDDARVAALLNDAPVIESEGRAFPVETRYLGRDPLKRIEDEVVAAIRLALREETGSILVFLPGQSEIRRVETLLRERISDSSIVVTPLYGAMEQSAQDEAVAPARPGTRKIVLATAIAETSLTIEGVRVVIDAGLARVPRFEPELGLTRLETVRVSRAAADQRRGRAGRTEPGVCYRLWEEAATGALHPFAKPEILSADLSGLLLDCAEWGVGDPATLRFLDRPPQPALAEARLLLQQLGALDGDGRITPLGRAMRRLPLPPRLARMVVAAGEEAGLAAEIAAIMTERGLGGSATHLGHRIDEFRRDRGARAQQMRRLMRPWARETEPVASERAGAILALAFPDRVAKARGALGSFVMANGRGAMVAPHDVLAREEVLAIAEIAGEAGQARILLAAPLTLHDLEQEFADRIEDSDVYQFDKATASLRLRRMRRLGAITLSEQTRPVPSSEEAAIRLAQDLSQLGIDALPWSRGLSQWRDRVMFLRRAEPEQWPDLSDTALAETIETWLAPHLVGKTALSQIGPDLLDQALKTLLDWSAQRRIDAEAPTHFEAPTGHRHPIDYEAEAGPVLAIRVQELFGMRQHPAVANGKLPLVLHLLSPGHRPIQITRDLPGFWAGSWSAVKSEMKGRYPKHPWPDDPASATPTSRAKPRGS